MDKFDNLRLNHGEIHPQPHQFCEACQLIPMVVVAQAEVESLRIQLEAWQSVFGTSQLSHAQARLEAAERVSEIGPSRSLEGRRRK